MEKLNVQYFAKIQDANTMELLDEIEASVEASYRLRELTLSQTQTLVYCVRMRQGELMVA